MVLPSFVKAESHRQIEERQHREQQQAQDQQRKQQEREAHEAAEREAMKIAKETEGSQNIKVRTTFSDTSAESRISGRTINRTERLPNQQYAQSGAPVNLQGDPQAIQKVRAEAFQRARERGGTVDKAAVDRATRDILAERGGSISIIDEAGRREAVNEAYQDLKFNYSFGGGRSIGESDDAILTPVSGIRSRSVFEGFTESGGKKTVAIGKPIVEKVELGFEEKPPNDFFAGAGAEFKNIGESVAFSLTDLFGGRKVPRMTVNSTSGEIISKQGMPTLRPTAEAETLGAIGGGQSFLTLGGKPVGGSVLFTPQTFENFGKSFGKFAENPAYFAGTAATSVALWLSPAAAGKVARSLTSSRYGFSITKPLGKSIPFGAQDVSVKDYPAFVRGEIPVRGEAALHLQHLKELEGIRTSDIARFSRLSTVPANTPSFNYDNSFNPIKIDSFGKPLKFSTSTDIFTPPKGGAEPLITATLKKTPLNERMSTLADIDKRLGLNVKDKGGFTEIKTRGGQVMLLKKPEQIAIQKPIVLTKQESALIPRIKPLTRQQQRSFSGFTLGLGGETGLARVMARRKRQELGLSEGMFSGQIEREALQFEQTASLTQLLGLRSKSQQQFKQDQSMAQVMKQLQKSVLKEQAQFKFQPITTQRQQFKFKFAEVTELKTIFDIPNPPPPGTPPPSLRPPVKPPFPIVGAFDYSFGKKKKGKKGKAALREGQIKDLVTVALGEQNQMAKQFRKGFGKLF